MGSAEGFLKDLKMRAGAAAVFIIAFFCVGYVKRTDFLGVSVFLTGEGFLLTAFGLVFLAWLVYIVYLYFED